MEFVLGLAVVGGVFYYFSNTRRPATTVDIPAKKPDNDTLCYESPELKETYCFDLNKISGNPGERNRMIAQITSSTPEQLDLFRKSVTTRKIRSRKVVKADKVKRERSLF